MNMNELNMIYEVSKDLKGNRVDARAVPATVKPTNPTYHCESGKGGRRMKLSR